MTSIFKIIYIKWRFRLKSLLAPSSLSDYEHLKEKKKCLVMLAADYGNLGDVAITYAQEKYLEEHFPEHEIVDIPISKTLSHIKALKKICTSDDIITIVGGGNMSDLYFDIELLRQMVVKAFPENRIILFPQTMFFSNSINGKYMRKLVSNTYSKHNRIIISAREHYTFALMSKLLPLDAKLTPDIVMTLDKRIPVVERKGITLCLRDDAESNLTRGFRNEIKEYFKSRFEISEYDTHIGRSGLRISEREYELNKIWQHFRESELVITDRLHGMIFAFITGTPAIVFSNNNHKIEGCYQWIKDCGFIFYVDQPNLNIIDELLGSQRINHFDEVSATIKNKFLVLCQD